LLAGHVTLFENVKGRPFERYEHIRRSRITASLGAVGAKPLHFQRPRIIYLVFTVKKNSAGI
jgi:hypothetical protein